MVIDELLGVLAGTPHGPVTESATIRAIAEALQSCWTSLQGSDAEAMEPYKLSGRIEALRWDPPRLEFVIERHGGTVKGSSRAELHTWSVDVHVRTATCRTGRHRQLRPARRALKVEPLAERIVTLIENRQADPAVKWLQPDRVQINIGQIIPVESAPAQTIVGRRKRFWRALDDLLGARGWQRDALGRRGYQQVPVRNPVTPTPPGRS